MARGDLGVYCPSCGKPHKLQIRTSENNSHVSGRKSMFCPSCFLRCNVMWEISDVYVPTYTEENAKVWRNQSFCKKQTDTNQDLFFNDEEQQA